MNDKETLFASILCLGLLATCVHADTLRLVNGDTIRGNVVSVDQKEVKLESRLLGTLAIPRNRVQMIAFGDAPLDAPVTAPEKRPGDSAAASPTGNPVVDHLKSQGIDPKVFGQAPGQPAAAVAKSPSGGTVQDAVRQLQSQGLDPALVKQLQETFPLLGTPGVQKYFNETVSGLATGEMDVQDLRKKAIGVRGQLLELQKDLGPEAAAALAPYAAILDHFIRESAPPGQSSSSDQTSPGSDSGSKAPAKPRPSGRKRSY